MSYSEILLKYVNRVLIWYLSFSISNESSLLKTNVKIARIISGLIYLIYLNSKWNIKYNLGFVAYEAEDFKRYAHCFIYSIVYRESIS
jgi:hypothetical protein